MKLLLKNVRGFEGSHQLSIKPVTLVVGENSSGKTTLLAALAAALQLDFPSIDVFNRTPFELGSFDTIATYRGGKYGRAPSFSIGWDSERAQAPSYEVEFESHLGIPRVKDVRIDFGSTWLQGSPQTGTWTLNTIAENKDHHQTVFAVDPGDTRLFTLADVGRLYSVVRRRRAHYKDPAPEGISARDPFEWLFEVSTALIRSRPRVTALAPLRTRPKRTYDELIEEFKPEGDHIPLVLSRLFAKGANESAVADAIEEFGKEAGLFRTLHVRRMGRHSSDPFQLQVKGAGPDANLVDVGYGVSQALPIVVDSVVAPKGRVVLVQQPEVHLHPKAQAALGSFFCELAKDRARQFVIETHSDYLIDRVRMAVANKIIAADAVNIAFLDRNGLDVTIHELALDPQGNIVNAPSSYRKFFLEEETRLLFRGA